MDAQQKMGNLLVDEHLEDVPRLPDVAANFSWHHSCMSVIQCQGSHVLENIP